MNPPQSPFLLQTQAAAHRTSWRYAVSSGNNTPVPVLYEDASATAAHSQNRSTSTSESGASSGSLQRPRPISPVSEFPIDEHDGEDFPPRKKHKGPQNSFPSRPASTIASTTPVIAVRAGREDAKTFYVHKGQLTKSSLTLKYLLEDVSLESLSLFNLNPAAFTVYVDWLYADSITCKASTDQEKKDMWTGLAFAYMLGSELKDQAF